MWLTSLLPHVLPPLAAVFQFQNNKSLKLEYINFGLTNTKALTNSKYKLKLLFEANPIQSSFTNFELYDFYFSHCNIPIAAKVEKMKQVQQFNFPKL